MFVSVILRGCAKALYHMHEEQARATKLRNAKNEAVAQFSKKTLSNPNLLKPAAPEPANQEEGPRPYSE
jgi:hypothetical protein